MPAAVEQDERPAIYLVAYLGADGRPVPEVAPYTHYCDPVAWAGGQLCVLDRSLYAQGAGAKRKRIMKSTEEVFVLRKRRAPVFVPDGAERIVVTSREGYHCRWKVEHFAWRRAELAMPERFPEAASGHGEYDAYALEYAHQRFPCEWTPDPQDLQGGVLVHWLCVLPPESNEASPLPLAERRRLATEVGRVLCRSAFPAHLTIRLCGQDLRYAAARIEQRVTVAQARQLREAAAARQAKPPAPALVAAGAQAQAEARPAAKPAGARGPGKGRRR